MNILYATQVLESGIGIVRAKWPARWTNKFTEHTAQAMDESDLLYSDLADVIKPFDLISIHKTSQVLSRLATEARRLGKTVVYDTDDHDDALYDSYYLKAYMNGAKGYRDQICTVSNAITCTSIPLARQMHGYGKPVAVIDNGYDTTLEQYQITTAPYFEGMDGEWLKIVYGGSTGHARDIAMFFQMGIIEALSEHRIDWYFYGCLDGPPRQKQVGNSQIRFLPGEPINSYMHSFYSDASIVIAPLVIDAFNDCRSSIKLIEAGLCNAPVVASDIESYRNFSDGVTLVNNTPEQWVTALHGLILQKDVRTLHGQHNNNAVYARFTAEKLIQERIAFYENIHP